MKYDYQCTTCQHVFEARHPMDYAGSVPCPECGSGDTFKVISAPTIVLDWYKSESVHDSIRFRPPVSNRVLAGREVA